MFYTYLQVLFWRQPHGSCRTFREPHSKNFHVVLDHGLDAHLVVHVLDEFLSGCQPQHLPWPCIPPRI